jgi:hypothetical protein
MVAGVETASFIGKTCDASEHSPAWLMVTTEAAGFCLGGHVVAEVHMRPALSGAYVCFVKP